ncbi:MAG: HD domain-containing protein [Campylobacterales bacterium]|nr:HD domain-containing protein [Campylobacterales bacterium]
MKSREILAKAELLSTAIHEVEKSSSIIFEDIVMLVHNKTNHSAKIEEKIKAIMYALDSISLVTIAYNNNEIKNDIMGIRHYANSFYGILDDKKEGSNLLILDAHKIIEAMHGATSILRVNIQKEYENELLKVINKEHYEKYATVAIVIFFFVLLGLLNKHISYSILTNLSKLKERIASLFYLIDGKSVKINDIVVDGDDEIVRMVRSINEHVEVLKKIINDERTATEQLKALKENLLEKIEIATKESIDLYREIEDTQKEVVYTLGMIAEERCNETSAHVKRVSEFSLILARLAGLDEREAHEVKYASPMHDIGKIGIPDGILKKPGKLTDEELKIMCSHPAIGYEILKHSDKSILKSAAIVAHEHHEKYNGLGYPRGLTGNEIHIYARIVAIADVFDALGSERAYKKAWPIEDIVSFFQKESGEHFDPTLSELFLNNMQLFITARDKVNSSMQYIDRNMIEDEIEEQKL